MIEHLMDGQWLYPIPRAVTPSGYIIALAAAADRQRGLSCCGTLAGSPAALTREAPVSWEAGIPTMRNQNYDSFESRSVLM